VKKLLEFIVQYVEFPYLNPEYRITDSSTRGVSGIDASVSFTGERLKWDAINDCGIIYFAAVPAFQKGTGDWFAVSLIRQHLEGGDDTGAGSPIDEANWLSTNLKRVEQLFAGEATSERVCEELVALRRSNSSTKWGWPKPE
jgi:hypothetical protein